MSKQVEIKDNTLIVHTRENYESVNKVICVCKGKTGVRVFYTNDNLTLDFDKVKDWRIGNYRVEDLILISHLLDRRGVLEYDLRDWAEAFKTGYRKAQEEFKEAIDRSVNKIIKGGL